MRRLALLAISLSLLGNQCLAQEPTVPEERKPPAVELLTMGGSKPSLSPSGEGITSIKTTDLFQRGVTHAKLFEPNFPIELPAGYTLFNKLVYQIDSEAVVSGPDDFVFYLPSATTKESFDQLRILIAERDSADPEKPRWVDATLIEGMPAYLVNYLSPADFEKRLPDFKTHTLHAFMENPSSVMVVALKDTRLARDHFVADLSLTGTAPPQVMEGRTVTYNLKVTNNGPDTATGVSLHAQPSFEFVSATASQGKCRMEASNVYCKIGSLEKGRSVDVTIIEQCRWDGFVRDAPVAAANSEGKSIKIDLAEDDPIFDNNSLFLLTDIIEDPNKAPLAEITSPKEDELFVGPEASITIVAKASDPDGFVNKIEFFDGGVPIGKGTLIGKDQYQLNYEKVSLGRHWLEVKTTDNLGREAKWGPLIFFVNGLARVEFSEPKAGALLDRSEVRIPVTVHASHPNLGIKEVKVFMTSPGMTETTALPVGNDLYVANIDCSFCKRDAKFVATVIDDSGVETRSAPISFKLRKPPVVTLYHEAGEFLSRLPEDQPFEFLPGAKLNVGLDDDLMDGLNVVKVDFLVNGKLIETYTQEGPDTFSNRYIDWDFGDLEPGSYKIQAIATDSDGSVGKSAVVPIVIMKRP